MQVVSDQDVSTLGWFHRRFGLGEHIAITRAQVVTGVDPATVLLDATEDDRTDPWSDREISTDASERTRAIREWVAHLAQTNTATADRLTFELHGWLVSSLGAVPTPLMVGQIRRFITDGSGSFPDLLRAITIDPAMLVYLDGRTSQAAAPNENYARELLELFALGTGSGGAAPPYSEADVAAAAAALTGWTVRRDTGSAQFVPRRHDDTPQTLLGVSGVSDVDGVIDAIVAHPEHDRFVARRIATLFVGAPTTERGDRLAPDPDVIDELATAYEAGGRHLHTVVEAAARLVIDDVDATRHHPLVAAPIPWMVGAARMLGVRLDRLELGPQRSIQEMGQVPLAPPSVAGWEGGLAWLTTSSLVARATVADAVANAASVDQPLLVAADDGDVDTLAIGLGLREPFSSQTAAAIRGAATPRARLTLALISPENLLT